MSRDSINYQREYLTTTYKKHLFTDKKHLSVYLIFISVYPIVHLSYNN